MGVQRWNQRCGFPDVSHLKPRCGLTGGFVALSGLSQPEFDVVSIPWQWFSCFSVVFSFQAQVTSATAPSLPSATFSCVSDTIGAAGAASRWAQGQAPLISH